MLIGSGSEAVQPWGNSQQLLVAKTLIENESPVIGTWLRTGDWRVPV
jgi:hypothetical protein